MTPKCLCGEPTSFCVCSGKPDTIAKISRPVRCDFCWDTGVIQPAAVDGKVKDARHWAFFCAFHWSLNGVGRLGSGLGQRLVLEAPKDSTAPNLDATLDAPRSKINYDSLKAL